jgi:multidrug efflux pump subunit AcrA (membrane-fusion protein)
LLAQLADVTKMHVLAQIDAAQIGAVRRIAPPFAQPGKTRTVSDEELFGSATDGSRTSTASPPPHHVKVTAEAFPDEVFDGVIERILPEPRRLLEGSAFDVRIRLVGSDIVRLLSLPVHVDFSVDRKKSVVRVPNEAVVQDGRESFVFCPAQGSQSPVEQEKKIRVRVGPTDGAFTEIIAGLTAGDRIWVRRPKPREQTEPKPASPIMGTIVGTPVK